jgi:hypothetical protein
VRDVSDTQANPAQMTQSAQQPAAQVAQAAGGQNMSLDLLRMAGLLQPPQQVQQQVQAPAAPAAGPSKPAESAQVSTAPKPAETAPAAKNEPAADVAALQAQLAAIQAQHRATVIRALVERVALTGGAINAADVLKLVADELDVATNGSVIAKGDPRTSGEQHVARFLAARPHMLKPLVAGGGAGASPVASPPNTQSPPKADMSSNEAATRLARQIAEQRGYLPPARQPQPTAQMK